MSERIALEEFKHLQTIIGRHEDHAFKVRSVMYALLTGLSAAVFAHPRMLTGSMFLILALLVIGLFLTVEMVHRAMVRLAIDRVSALEVILRSQGEIPYDGPLIGASMGQHRLRQVMLTEVLMPWILIHYAGLVATVIGIAIAAW